MTALDKFLGDDWANAVKSADSCLGITVMMNCNKLATCVADRGHDDIDIEFEDGKRVEHVRRPSFLKGLTKHPDIRVWEYALQDRYSLVGSKDLMNCGYVCEVIADRGAMDIDVKFECDGTILRHRRRDHFLKGAIAYPTNKSILGERRMMNCGYYCVVIRDGGAMDIDVQFEVDDLVLKHRRRDHFRHCSIVHPKMGTLFGQKDSMCQRLLYYYIKSIYPDAKYSVYPTSLKRPRTKGYEIDIMLWDIKTAIEFDGSVPHHFNVERTEKKRAAIEASSEIDKLFVVRDNDRRIVMLDSPKTTNIHLTYTSDDMRYYDTYEAAKVVLEELGNDVSSLAWDEVIIPFLYKDGIQACDYLLGR